MPHALLPTRYSRLMSSITINVASLSTCCLILYMCCAVYNRTPLPERIQRLATNKKGCGRKLKSSLRKQSFFAARPFLNRRTALSTHECTRILLGIIIVHRLVECHARRSGPGPQQPLQQSGFRSRFGARKQERRDRQKHADRWIVQGKALARVGRALFAAVTFIINLSPRQGRILARRHVHRGAGVHPMAIQFGNCLHDDAWAGGRPDDVVRRSRAKAVP